MLEISEWRNSSSIKKKNIKKKNSFVVPTNQTKQDIFAFYKKLCLTDFSFFFSMNNFPFQPNKIVNFYAMQLGYKKTRLNSASKHTLSAPQYGQYLTHAYSHITRAVASMDSCVAIIRLQQHTADLVVCAYWLYLVLFIWKKAFNWRVLGPPFLGPRFLMFIYLLFYDNLSF